MDVKLERQVKLSRMLGLGFAFSIVQMGGIGSLVALIIGLKARKIIRASSGELYGIKMAWWCIVVGALGVLTIPPFLIWIIISHPK